MYNTRQSATKDAAQEVPGPVVYSKTRTFFLSSLFAPGAGLAASLSAVVMMGALRLLAGIPTPVELFGFRILKSIDVHTFVRLLITFAPNSKTGPLALALLGMIGLGVLLAFLYAAFVRLKLPVAGYRPGRREWLTAGAFVIVMTLIGVVLFWNELRQNGYGLPIGWATATSILGLLLDFGLYGVVLCLAYRALLPKQPMPGVSSAGQGRRQLLSRLGVAALSVGAGAGSAGLVRSYLNGYSSYDGMTTPLRDNKTVPITPNSDHYVVTQNTVDPVPNIALWRLEITGLVRNSGSYTFAELRNLPSVSRAITLECISNQIGSQLMGTAIWQGVTLRSLLDRHGGALPTATHVAFYSVDGYNMSLPLKDVLDADALLAWSMNGMDIPQRHGYPVRVLIPGYFGEQNPKWLTRVELTDHFVHGLYSSQGWYNGPLHTVTRIDYPKDRVQAGSTIEVSGIAFAGNRGIQKVEISTNGGASWQEAKLQPALSKDTWVLWTWQWTPSTPGSYTLVGRATDGTGIVQTNRKQGTVPNGATGYHQVQVQVV